MGVLVVEFLSFLTLLVISVIVALILHFGVQHFVRTGWDSFTSKVILGYIGAWIGPYVFGKWPETVKYEEIYVIPAFLGAAALIIFAVDLIRSAKN